MVDSDFELLGNMFLALVRDRSGIESIVSNDNPIELPMVSGNDIANPLTVDQVTIALQEVEAKAPHTVAACKTLVGGIVDEVAAAQGADDSVVANYIQTGSTAIQNVFQGISAVISAKNTKTTVNTSSNVNTSATHASSENTLYIAGGVAVVALIALVVWKK